MLVMSKSTDIVVLNNDMCPLPKVLETRMKDSHRAECPFLMQTTKPTNKIHPDASRGPAGHDTVADSGSSATLTAVEYGIYIEALLRMDPCRSNI